MAMGIGDWHARVEAPAAPGFGSQLRRWRTLRGLTKAQLARMIDGDPSTITRLESGSRPNPERRTVIALANALELTGAQRIAFLALAGFLEHPLTDAQASYLAAIAAD